MKWTLTLTLALVGCPGPKTTDDTSDTTDTSVDEQHPSEGVWTLDNALGDNGPFASQSVAAIRRCVAANTLPVDVSEEEFVSATSVLAAKLIDNNLMDNSANDYFDLCTQMVANFSRTLPPPAPYPPDNCPEDFTSDVFRITKWPDANFAELHDLEQLTKSMDFTQLDKEDAANTTVEGCWIAVDLAEPVIPVNTIWFALFYAQFHFGTASTLRSSGVGGDSLTSVYGGSLEVTGDPADVLAYDMFFQDPTLNPPPSGPLAILVSDVKFGDFNGMNTSFPDSPVGTGTPACTQGEAGTSHPFDLCPGTSPASIIDPANQNVVDSLNVFTEWAGVGLLEGSITLSFGN